jgi:hypothetical protein
LLLENRLRDAAPFPVQATTLFGVHLVCLAVSSQVFWLTVSLLVEGDILLCCCLLMIMFTNAQLWQRFMMRCTSMQIGRECHHLRPLFHLCHPLWYLLFGCTVEGNPASWLLTLVSCQLVQLPLYCTLTALEKMTTK